MTELTTYQWLTITGLGALWLGVQIVVVGGLPRVLRFAAKRRGEVPTATPGTPQAFGLFWLDQYSMIGLSLAGIGVVLAVAGSLR